VGIESHKLSANKKEHPLLPAKKSGCSQKTTGQALSDSIISDSRLLSNIVLRGLAFLYLFKFVLCRECEYGQFRSRKDWSIF